MRGLRGEWGASGPLVLVLGLVGFIMALMPDAWAQFQVHQWESFEAGKLPATMSLGHHASVEAGNINVVSLNDPRFRIALAQPRAAVECENFAAYFQPTKKTPHLSLVAPEPLHRSRLGANGVALYQADFWLPAPGIPCSNMALLAIQVEPGAERTFSYIWYRFGIEDNRILYFSYANEEGAGPKVFHHQDLTDFPLNRPGWNRLQIIFQGRDRILCAANGEMTSFSPIIHGDHQNLTPGLFVAIPTDVPDGTVGAPVIIDNLSIQWTPNPAPLPDSPWLRWTETADMNLKAFDSRSTVWIYNPHRALAESRRQNKPMLTMFYIPRSDPYTYLNSIAPTLGQASGFLRNYQLLRVDTNQLYGSLLAKRFNVVRTPTLLVLGPDGKEMGRLTIKNKETQWSEVQTFLQGKMAAPAAK